MCIRDRSMEEMGERLKCRNAMQVGAALSVLMRNGAISRHDVPGPVSYTHLVDCYFSTVGQNSNVLPNLSPNKEGIIPEADARRMIQFGKTQNNTLFLPVRQGNGEKHAARALIQLTTAHKCIDRQ